MANSKYNWGKLKLDFFESDFTDVKTFLIEKCSFTKRQLNSNNTAVKTKGWAKEKKNIFNDSFKRARKNMVQSVKPYIEKYLMTLMEAKTCTINSLMERLYQDIAIDSPDRLSMKISDIKIILEMIKNELGEPIKVQKNQNENLDINVLMDQIQKSDEPVDQRKLEREIYGDREVIEIEIDGVKM